jgi:hypothetical protein
MKYEPVRDAAYQLVIGGELDERYGYLFEGMEIEHSEGKTRLTTATCADA